MLADCFFSRSRPRASSPLRRLGITQAVALQVDSIDHCCFAGPDRKDGPDFGPAVVDELAAAGIYVCPTMNVHAFTLRKRFGDALER
jgi:hypothetical protein